MKSDQPTEIENFQGMMGENSEISVVRGQHHFSLLTDQIPMLLVRRSDGLAVASSQLLASRRFAVIPHF
jgi:hypothetical protein